MSDQLDVDSQRLVDRLAEIAERKLELNSLELNLKAELRQRLRTGVKYADDRGRPRVQLRPNRRFSPDLAVGVLDPVTYAQCLVPTLDPKRVKELVPPAVYEKCQVESDPAVVLL